MLEQQLLEISEMVTKILLFFTSLMILILGFLPLIQAKLNILPAHPLDGAIINESKPALSLEALKNGTYQPSYTKFIEDSMPLKAWYVRINNQIDYSLFGVLHAKYCVVGKDGFLFESSYIKSYTGGDYIGQKAVNEMIDRLKWLNSEFVKRNIHFIIVFAPSKARFMPDKITDDFLKDGIKRSNYEDFEEILSKKETGIPFIDFNKYFCQLKSTSRYPLYPKGGTHWSIYSALSIAADSMIRYMENLSGRKIPEMKEDGVEWTNELRMPDDDISRGLNLLFRYPAPKMPYPHFADIKDNTLWKPNLLVVADSYYWTIYPFSIMSRSFTANDFWFYNETRYPREKYAGIEKSPMQLKDDLLRHDFVILMMTEPNLTHMLHFPEKTVALLDPNNPEALKAIREREERVKYYINAIRNTPDWFKLIVSKAIQKKIPVEEALKSDAEYMADTEKK